MISFTLLLSTDLNKKLTKEANDREIARADIVREALREYFNQKQPKHSRGEGMVPLVPIVEKE